MRMYISRDREASPFGDRGRCACNPAVGRDRGRTEDSGVKVGMTLFSPPGGFLTDRGRTEDSGVRVGMTLFSPRICGQLRQNLDTD